MGSRRFRSILLCALAALSLAPFPARSGPRDPCEGFKVEEQRKICYEKKYKEADYELNQVYSQLQKELPKDQAQEMKESSRAWIRMKEYNCGYRAEMESGRAGTQNADYFNCLLDYTRGRIRYLRQAFAGEGVSPGLPGSYGDGEGGRLTLIKKTDDRFDFQLEVVRGPTAHIGEIRGAITPLGGKAQFTSREYCNEDDPGEKEACCRILFQFKKYHVKVEEKNCSYFHGAKAYFDGEYRKIR